MPRSESPELLDHAAWHDLAELRGNLHDMARYDRWLGVFDTVLKLAQLHEARTALDIGVGSGEFITFAQQRRPHTNWVVLDLSRAVLNIAREHTSAPQVQARAQHLPFVDGAFDVVTCANTLHHLNDADAVWLLRECARVGKRGVVADLARQPLTTVGAWLLTHLTSRNRLTRTDGVHSAQRAYTVAEVQRLVAAAGWRHWVIHQHLPSQFVAVCVVEA
jgi:ubiquinone/menaquinone biosynthesis C-methylase UbiE